MKLPRPFVKLPLRFDAERLRQEIAALPASAWGDHPTGYEGNTAVRLISVDGGENDQVGGQMKPTPHLAGCAYIRQILSTFNTVWSRSRLMRLAPGAQVPVHADINYHWYHRVRLHVPIVTQPGVRFTCGDQTVHMAAGEAWIFDNWRLHRVENDTPQERIHLVADTTGSSAFWQLVGAGARGGAERTIPFRPDATAPLLVEKHNVYRVMPPSEMEQLMFDLVAEATTGSDDGVPAVRRFAGMVEGFCQDWRQLWSLYADTEEGLPFYRNLVEQLRTQLRSSDTTLRTRTNNLQLQKVIEARAFKYAVAGGTRTGDEPDLPPVATRPAAPPAAAASGGPKLFIGPRLPEFRRPVFIVAAPRSGSTMLFETLAVTPQFLTVGGEAHWLVEGVPQLQPGAPGVDSNRLEARHATEVIAGEMRLRIAERLVDPAGTPRDDRDDAPVRFLEKTPKNALRIPFFDRVFPDALFVYLWRDPRENISSIMEAWKTRRWVTYPRLPGWDGPWSLLLPPGWQELRGRPLAEVAAYQWRVTNQIIMDDLAALPAERRVTVRYADLVANPARAAARLAQFAGIEFDAALAARTAAALPHSRYTLTAPREGKWRANAEHIEPLIPGLYDVVERLARFG